MYTTHPQLNNYLRDIYLAAIYDHNRLKAEVIQDVEVTVFTPGDRLPFVTTEDVFEDLAWEMLQTEVAHLRGEA